MAQNVNIPNNLVLAILTTIFCCLPIGIVAILQATKVNNLVAEGKYGEAQEASAKAKKFAIIAVVAYFVVLIISAIAGGIFFFVSGGIQGF